MSETSSAEHGFRVLAAVLRYQKPLVAYATSLLGDLERSRDVVQETFLRLCGEEGAFAGDRVAPWLFRVCRNLCIDELRRSKRLTPFDDVDTSDDAPTRLAADPTIPDVVELRRDATTVLHLIGSLPRKQQDVLRLRFLGELSYREIAKVTELAETYVGFLIHAGLKTIRERLARAPHEVGLTE